MAKLIGVDLAALPSPGSGSADTAFSVKTTDRSGSLFRISGDGIATISGSFAVTGSAIVTGGITGSLQGTASFATTSSYAQTTTLTVGSTPISTGTNSRVLFQNGGVLQQTGSLTYGTGLKILSNGANDSFIINNSADSDNLFKVTKEGYFHSTYFWSFKRLNGTTLELYSLTDGVSFREGGTPYALLGLNESKFGNTNSNNSVLAIRTSASYGGEYPLGSVIQGLGTNGSVIISAVAPSTSSKVMLGYYNGTSYASALEYNNVSTGGTVVKLLQNGSGAVSIGQATNGARLDVKAQGALSSDLALRVRNSADTADLLSVAGNGTTTLSSLIATSGISIQQPSGQYYPTLSFYNNGGSLQGSIFGYNGKLTVTSVMGWGTSEGNMFVQGNSAGSGDVLPGSIMYGTGNLSIFPNNGATSGSLRLVTKQGSTYYSAFEYNTSGSLLILLDKNNIGNVGIGKSTANAKLDVNGNTIITGSLNVTGGITGSLQGTASYALTAGSTAAVAGTSNYVSKFTSGTTIGNSQLFDNGTNVGIGTTSPSGKFHVLGASTDNVGLAYFENNHSAGGLYYPAAQFVNSYGNHSYGIVAGFKMGNASGPDRPSILFYNDTAAKSWQIGQISTGWGSDDDFGIGYRASNDPNSFGAWPTNYFTITSAGNVGIGTSTPLLTTSSRGNITINGSSQSILTLAAGDTWKTYLYTDGTNTDLSSANALIFGTNGGTERMRITPGGSLLLGDAIVPGESAWFGTAVFGKNGTNKVITGYLSSTTNGAVIGGHNSALSAWAPLNIDGTELRFNIQESRKMTLDASGNLGIGTTSPSSKLHVEGNAAPGNYAAYIHNASGGGNVLKLYNHDWDVTDYLLYATNGGGYSFVVDGNGKVGIGTTSPTAKLHVAAPGALSSDIGFKVRNSANTGDILNALGNGNVQIGVGGLSICRTDSPNASLVSNITYQGDGNLTFSTPLRTSKVVSSGGASSFIQLDNYKHTNQVLGGDGSQVNAFIFSSLTAQGLNSNSNNFFTVANGSNDLLTIKVNGDVGIGKSTPTAKLDVSGSVAVTGSVLVNTTNQTLGQFVGTTNGYSEFSVRNTSTGISASGDIAVYADNGTVTNNYIDMGINNSGLSPTYFYGGTDFGNANDAYVYNVGGNLRIGNATSVAPYSQSFYLFSNPSATPDIAITGSKVGIGISSSMNSKFTVYGSGSSVMSILGSQGELFSVTDSLSGSLFSVNDISGLPILEVFSDNTTLIGSYQAPSLNTTVKTTTVAGNNVIYSIPTASYNGAWFEYVATSASNARAGQIMSVCSSNTIKYTETTTTDIGTTAGLNFMVMITGSNFALTGSSTTAGWSIKTIVRSI